MDANDSELWQDTVGLLRLVKKDYETARKQLETACEDLSRREYVAKQRLAQALLLSGGYKPLCLIPVVSGTLGNQIGRVTLGVTAPYRIPGPLRLEVRCFERMEVCSGTKKIDYWQNSNAKTLFRLFMTRPGKPIVKEMIMEYLWPECNLHMASNNLKVAMHGLRKIINHFLGQSDSYPSIIFKSGNYELNPEIELWIDVEEFERHYTKGRRLEKEGNLTAAIKEFEMADALYRGDYFAEEPYDDRTMIRREALKDTYLTVVGKLADHFLETGEYEESIIYSQKIIAKDSCREDAYRRLMRCYSRLGNRNRAIRWYEICCQAIQAELDTISELETDQLYHRLLNSEYI